MKFLAPLKLMLMDILLPYSDVWLEKKNKIKHPIIKYTIDTPCRQKDKNMQLYKEKFDMGGRKIIKTIIYHRIIIIIKGKCERDAFWAIYIQNLWSILIM